MSLRDPDLVAAAERGLAPTYWAQRHTDRLVLITDHGDRTDAELDGNANRLVRGLRRRGVRAGDAVALLCGNRPEFVETATAAGRAGLRLTPINWHLTGDEAGYIVDDCEATAIVADARDADVARRAADLAPRLTAKIAVGGPIDGFDEWDDVVAAEDGAPLADTRLGERMLYTSGTTGHPKGVRRRSDVAAILAEAELSQYDADTSVHLCTGPLYHAASLTISMTVPMIAGAPLVVMDHWDAERTLQLVEQYRVTHTHLVPTMFHRLLSLPAETMARYDISSLRLVVHGAAPCPVDVKRRIIEWFGPVVWEYYAATEGAGTLVGPDEWLRKPGTVGRVRPRDQIQIHDELGTVVVPGAVGTIYLKAPPRDGARFEYYKAPDKTAGAYRGEYFTLGDVGYVDHDGYLFLTDRSAHLIISGGVNIYPAEIEAVLLGHPAVGDAGVVGVPDEEWGEVVVAAIETQPGVEATESLAAELVEWCRGQIAHYKCPRQVVFVETLPRHDNGKLYKHQLREQLRA